MPSRKSVSRKNRASRKVRASRKSSKSHVARKTRSLRGGFIAPVNDSSMNMAMRNSLAQGSQYLNLHKGQYGGAVGPYPTAVTNSVLTGSMVASARTGPLDTALNQIQGMQDGGRRNKKMKGSRNKRMRSMRSMRNKRGGSMNGSPLSESSMLLPSGLEKQAALNYEWSAAKDPNAFAPKH